MSFKEDSLYPPIVFFECPFSPLFGMICDYIVKFLFLEFFIPLQPDIPFQV